MTSSSVSGLNGDEVDADAASRREASSSLDIERPSRMAGSLDIDGRLGGAVPGKYEGMERPGERKKRRGEAKGSKALAGDGKRCVLRAWRLLISHMSLSLVMVAGSIGDGGRDVAAAVQSKTPFRTMVPLIEEPTGRVRVSVREREVARVPPRKEP